MGPVTDEGNQTKWGVGFGPRDCSDYQTGVSIIPIERLTDADRKWLVNAEYGGTGGLPIEQFMMVEEPDIEIGAGVSSKGTRIRLPLWPISLTIYSNESTYRYRPRWKKRTPIFSSTQRAWRATPR